ncbi:tyrosine--tRNA ligase [Candidatus Woesearchaeota archaeon]|nr:tyrosine--tRNA ligase [Candidatus Woesearchaeota archaeon]
MTPEEKLQLIKRNTEEIMGEEDLKKMLENGTKLKHYIGFEISGKPHLGHGLVCMGKVKDFMDAGVECSIFLADWHSWINDKLGGDREVIKKMTNSFFKEVLIAAFKCVGGNPKDLKFVMGSELYSNNDKFWETVIDVSKHTSLSRILRSTTIMGRSEGEAIDFAKLIYPPMQVADIFAQDINIAHAGMDQRKAQVIARDVAKKLKLHPLKDAEGNVIKPVAVHGHLILGLQKPKVWPVPKEDMQSLWATMKMSKSIPNSAVFMTDSEEEVTKKINGAFCPEGIVDFNPVLDWIKHLIFVRDESTFEIERPEKFGGNLTFNSFKELEKAFKNKEIHPMDLKSSFAKRLNEILKPAREHFAQKHVKKAVEEMNKLTITR